MKALPSIAFEEMSGSAKGVTAAKTRATPAAENDCELDGAARCRLCLQNFQHPSKPTPSRVQSSLLGLPRREGGKDENSY